MLRSFEKNVCPTLINTEEKAKVDASVWGEEFIEFLAALAV